ncbi:transcription elongation factor, mitochondrial [Bombina bombina]|uniref:transcription elongation factor, mitochondrial n=1 Tax=Bombina bombina TaxID=8345 RepID=UPI00235B10CA|nr:transcription elongation factor, mitochondrial [Bombina bombina]
MDGHMIWKMIRSMQRVFRAGTGIFLRNCHTSTVKHRSLHCSSFLGKALVDGELIEQQENEPEGTLNEVYTSEQSDTILETLNTATESELANIKLLRGKKSASIVQYRETHGPFLDLDQVLNVPYFKYKMTVKVCESILNPVERGPKGERKLESRTSLRFFKPEVTEDRLEATESIVSIVFGIRKIAWAHVDRKMTVLDWKQEEWYRFMKGAYHAHVYLEDISSAVDKLPKADLYILEKPGISIQNSSLYPVMLHLRTVEAMLYALLNTQYATDWEHRVLSIGRNTVGKHFELMLGESRTSGIEILTQMFTDSFIHGQKRIHFPQDMVFRYRNQFQSKGQNRNEELCDALLQAIAFYELAFTTQNK